MSRSSRRTFNQRLGKFLLTATVPPAVLKQCQTASGNWRSQKAAETLIFRGFRLLNLPQESSNYHKFIDHFDGSEPEQSWLDPAESLKISDRTHTFFWRQAAQTLTASTLSTCLSPSNLGIEFFPKNNINKFLAQADPEIELLVPTFWRCLIAEWFWFFCGMGSPSPKACIFTAGGTPHKNHPQIVQRRHF